METALRERGVSQASAATIYSAMEGKAKHLGFTFVGYPIYEGSPQSMLRGMSLLDVIEMLIDWKAATERHANGSILKSIEINQSRFRYSDDLKRIFLNTVEEMGLA